jgi:hypothetical protein
MKMIRNRSDFSKEYFQDPSEKEDLSKRTFLKGVAFACLGIAPFLNTCSIFGGGDTNQGSVSTPDNPVKKGSVPKVAKPPVDLVAPAKTETATFALG